MRPLRPSALRRNSTSGQVAAAQAEKIAGIDLPPDTQSAAFFDLDNTVLRGASLFYLARGMHSRKLLRTTDILRFGLQQLRFVVGAENDDQIDDARTAALTFITGRSVDELRDAAEQVFDDYMADKIWPGTQAIAEAHVEQGHRVWLVTAAPVEVAGVVAQRLGLTGALGTVAEQIANIYTGRLVGELLHGPAKAEAVQALAQREELELARCFAYSDSANDIPLLSLVGFPCAINPDRALREHARDHGWRIFDYRGRRRNTTLGVAAGVGAIAGAGTGIAIAVRKRN